MKKNYKLNETRDAPRQVASKTVTLPQQFHEAVLERACKLLGEVPHTNLPADEINAMKVYGRK